MAEKRLFCFHVLRWRKHQNLKSQLTQSSGSCFSEDLESMRKHRKPLRGVLERKTVGKQGFLLEKFVGVDGENVVDECSGVADASGRFPVLGWRR